jgi:hypothetical protein
MPRRSFGCALLAAFLSLVASAQDANQWDMLKIGMNMEEARRYLGEPLIRTQARGVERWIYDGRGEVVFYSGPLVAWTVASPSAESLARPVVLDVIFKAPLRNARIREQTTMLAIPDYARQESSTSFRYR